MGKDIGSIFFKKEGYEEELRKHDKSVKDSYNLDLDAFPDSASGSGSDAASGSGSDAASGMDSISGSGVVTGPDTVAGSVTGFVPALRLILWAMSHRIPCFAINKYRIDMTIHYNKKISNACEDEKIRSILG